MKKYFQRLSQKLRNNPKEPRSKTINRFWGLATRLEKRNVSGKRSK